MKQKVLVWLLSVCMVLTMMPLPAFATGTDTGKVAEVNGTQYESLQAAIEVAQNGDTVTVIKDINLGKDDTVDLDGYATFINVSNKTVTVDLNGNKLYGDVSEIEANNMGLVGFFSTEEKGLLTLKDSSSGKTGTVEAGTSDTGKVAYSLIVNYDSSGDSKITIESGNYILDKATDNLIYTNSDEGIIINGGNFHLGNVGAFGSGKNGQPWIFNAKGGNEKNVIVNGGTFNADINHQHWAHEVEVPVELALQKGNDNTYKVVPAECYVVEHVSGYDRWVGYATYEEALAAVGEGNESKICDLFEAKIEDEYYATLADAVKDAASGDKIELLTDVEVKDKVDVTVNVTIDGNGKTITWADGYTGTLFDVASGASLNIVNATIDGENAFTFYEDTTAVENGKNWYTRFVNVGDEDKAINADVFVNAGNLTLGEGTKIQNVTIASTGDNGKTANTESGGYYLMYNDDLALIKSNGGTVNMNGAEIVGNAGMVLNAINAETTVVKTAITGNMGAGNKGGIIIANGGKMSLDKDTAITYNKAMARSATVLGVIGGAEVTSEAKINNNKHLGVGSNTAGAIVVLEGASQFVMNGGSISDNVGGRAGAIASRWVGGSFGQHKDTSIVLNAGKIEGNSATNDSWNGASVFLRSPATIGEGMTIEGPIAVNAAPGELEVTGGKFNGSLIVTDGLTAEISGGTFNYDPSEWLAPSADIEEKGNGIYEVVEADYWSIRTVDDLKSFAKAVNNGETFAGKKVVLQNDLDLNGVAWTPIGGWDAAVQFLGEFDGKGKTISNLTIDDTNADASKYRAGLFADLGKGSKVHDLILEAVKVTNTKGGQVGALAGRSGASLENIKVDGIEINAASGAYAGGVVGITNYYDSGDYGFAWKNVDAEDVVIAFTGSKTSYGGGLLGGMNPNGARLNTYDDCDVTNVTITDENIGWHGGMWGWHGRSGAFNYVKGTDIKNVNITTKGTGESRVGGLCGFVGVSGGLMEDCHINGGKLTAGGGFAGGFTPWSYAWGQDTYKNCTVTDVEVTCQTGVAAGFIAAAGAGNQTSKCIDCTVDGGSVTGRIASGFAGIDKHGNAGGAYVLEGCTSSANVTGTEYAAGLIARASSSYVTEVNNSEFTGSVSGDGYVCDGVITTHTDKSLLKAYGVNVLYTNIKDDGKPVVEKVLATVTFKDSNTNEYKTLSYLDDEDARFNSLQKLIGTNDYNDFVLGASESELLAYAADGRASDITLTLYSDLEESLVLPNKYYQIAADYDITIDLNGYTLSSDAKKTIETFVDTTIIDGTVENVENNGRAVDMRGDIDLELDNVNLYADKSGGQALTVGGDVGEGNRAKVTTNSTSISALKGYAIIVYNPVDMTMTDSEALGYAALYFRAADGSQGSAGTVINAENTDFNSWNTFFGETNSFATMVFEDNDVTVDMKGGQISVVNKTIIGDADQCAVGIKDDVTGITVKTDKNTNIIYGNGDILAGYDYNEGHNIVLPATDNVKTKLEAEGYKFNENADGTLEVKEYVEWVKAELLAGNNVTLDRDINITDYSYVNALKLPSNGNGKYNEAHGNGAVFHVIKPGVELDLNGHSITWDAHDDYYCNKRQVSLFMVTVTGNPGETSDLTIKDSVGTGKVDVYGMGTGVYTVCVGAESTIEGGTWTNYPCKTCGASNIFMYPSHGGTMNITGGTFEQKESDYLIGWNGSSKPTTNNGVGSDQDETKVVISGGTFINFNPENVKFFDTANGSEESQIDGCANGYVAESLGNGNYGVVPFEAAKINETGKIYNSIQAAIDDATDGDTITVINDIAYEANDIITLEGNNGKYVTFANVADKKITIDLNGCDLYGDATGVVEGKELAGLISVSGTGDLTISDNAGNATVQVNTDRENVKGVLLTYSADAKLTVNDGKYSLNIGQNGSGLIYSSGDETVTINGGVYQLDNVGKRENGSPWIFNASGQNTRNIIVNGGTFNDDINHQYYPFEVVVPVEKAVKDNGDGTWTVVDSVAYVDEWEKSGNWYNHEVGYATIEEALAAAENKKANAEKAGEVAKVTMMKDTEAKDRFTAVDSDIVLDINGTYLKVQNFISFGDVIDSTDGNGGVRISNDRTKELFSLQQANSYLPLYDSEDGCYRMYAYEFYNRGEKVSNNNVAFGFTLKMNKVEAYELLEKEDCGLTIKANIGWTGREADLDYTVSRTAITQFTGYAKNQVNTEGGVRAAIGVTVKGLDQLVENGSVWLEPYIDTTCGVGVKVAEKMVHSK